MYLGKWADVTACGRSVGITARKLGKKLEMGDLKEAHAYHVLFVQEAVPSVITDRSLKK